MLVPIFQSTGKHGAIKMQSAKRSRQDIQDGFEHYVLQDLKQKGCQTTQYRDKESQLTKGDYRCVYPDRDYNLELKCFHTVWSIGLCVELIQDSTPLEDKTQPNSLGWFYNLIECHYLVVGYHDKPEQTFMLCVEVDLKRLRNEWDYVLRSAGSPQFRFSGDGFGSTVNIVIPWKTLDEFKMLSLMFKHEGQDALW